MLHGTQILAEYWADNVLLYIYDELNTPVGLKYRNSTYTEGVYDCFFFERNFLGDIIGIYNENGVKLGSYTYDAWGNFTVTATNATAGTLAYNILYNYNPFRYRGYYYDVETGLYYLQSRYYNPTWGRFVSADGVISGVGGKLLGHNQFAYCFNDPVNMIDESGEWGWLKKAVKWVAKEVVKPVVENVAEAVASVPFTYSAGLNVSLSLGDLSVGFQIAVSVDSSGHYAVNPTVSAGGSTGTPGFSAGVTHTVTNAPSVDALKGDSGQVGGSVSVNHLYGSADAVFFEHDNNIYQGGSIGFGVTTSTVGAEGHYLANKTFDPIFEGELRPPLINLYNAIMEW